MSERIDFRVCDDGDRQFLSELFSKSDCRFKDLPEEFRKQLLDQQFEIQDKCYRSNYPDAHFNLVLVNDDPVGRVYYDESADCLTLIEITLAPRCRNAGIGSGVIGMLQERASELGKPVQLKVAKDNDGAYRLYQRLGFSVISATDTHRQMQWNP